MAAMMWSLHCISRSGRVDSCICMTHMYGILQPIYRSNTRLCIKIACIIHSSATVAPSMHVIVIVWEEIIIFISAELGYYVASAEPYSEQFGRVR